MFYLMLCSCVGSWTLMCVETWLKVCGEWDQTMYSFYCKRVKSMHSTWRSFYSVPSYCVSISNQMRGRNHFRDCVLWLLHFKEVKGRSPWKMRCTPAEGHVVGERSHPGAFIPVEGFLFCAVCIELPARFGSKMSIRLFEIEHEWGLAFSFLPWGFIHFASPHGFVCI